MKSKSNMRGLLFIFSIAFFALNIKAQTTRYPNVAQSSYSNCKIVSISLESNKTTVLIEYEKNQPDRIPVNISISRYTILSDFYNDKDLYPIISLGSEQLDTKYLTTKKKGQKNYFTLIFPKLPPGLEKINIKEHTVDGIGFEWRGISINNPDITPQSNWTESSLKNNWQLSGIDNIEGIYESTIKKLNSSKYRVALKKNENGYDIIYLSGAESDFLGKWKEGAIKGSLIKTAKENFYKAQWFMNNKTLNENLYITFEEFIMKFIWTDGNPEQLYLKLYPTNSSSISNSTISSGTGFALSSNGLIITNHHVIEGAKSIIVKGINGNFSVSFNAKVVVDDKNNDLAIIKIEDNNFTSLGKIPYQIKSSNSEVGENVFVLGYPLRATMGEEIKLTNGIISSKTGFQGDITSYQVSAPIQPGNSGGPLFDKNGKLIGVINSKLKGGENVSYAIKVSYLKNLIELLPTVPILTSTTSISTLNLSEQVKILKKYVYIIESN